MGDSAVRRVAVAAEARNEVVRIEVHDTGPGIPTASQGTVFDVYARAAPSGISGLGLGLATVRRLAEVLGGRVGLESGTPAGSVFWIELPKARAGEKRPEQPATQSGVFRPIGKHLRALAAGRPAPRP
jgi:signal transduction histidine kinase